MTWTWTQTYSGAVVELLSPKPGTILLEDIAHQLALEDRFNGATLFAYPVGQHSLFVSERVEVLARELYDDDWHIAEASLWGLMHDGHEYLLGDITRPVKLALAAMASYDWVGMLSAQLDAAIQREFKINVTPHMRSLVKKADEELLATEQRDLMKPCDRDWGLAQEPLPITIGPMLPRLVRALFLRRFAELDMRRRR